MRNTIDTESITPGIKAFAWEGFCLKRDISRKKWIKGYDPKKLSPEADALDWADFQEEWYKEHGYT